MFRSGSVGLSTRRAAVAVALWLAPLVASAEYVRYYHGTNYDAAKAIHDNTNLTPQFFSQIESLGAPWDDRTDFGKGFYTHPENQWELAVTWARRAALERCKKTGNREEYWGVVIFNVDGHRYRRVYEAEPHRSLVFRDKQDRPPNAPYTQQPPITMSWLEFVEYNRKPWQDAHIQREGDFYDWSGHYNWIQGPIWVPRDSGIDTGGPQFPDHVVQMSWLANGLNYLLNHPSTARQLESGRVECPPREGPEPTPGPDPRTPDQEKLNACLCQCNAEGTNFSCAYDTEDTGWSPSCRKLANGPCICKAFGCFRKPPVTSGECYQRCVQEFGR